MRQRITQWCLALMLSLCAAVAPAATAPVAGKDYVVLERPQPTVNADGVEVREFFSYGCPHCATFEPRFKQWLKQAPEGVTLVQVPVVFHQSWAPLAKAFYAAQSLGELDRLHRDYTGRPSPLTDAWKLGEHAGGARILLKREDLNHTGSHKINNVLGQALLTKRMGKTRVIAETGAGQHGVATATACALLDLECVIYMGEVDTERQALNVARMRLLGATVIPVKTGSRTLKDAINEALRDWVTNVENTFYIIGTVAGPHPYPMMVRDFQSVIGEECLTQMPEMTGRQPDAVVACVGGGSNAMGIFYPYIPHEGTRLIGVEAAGQGLDSGRHAASISRGSPGVLHGNRTYLLQDDDGQILETHSVSAGLDYPGVGPEHAWLKDTGRAEYVGITDDEALAAFHYLCRTEGIIPALESSHAVAHAMKLAKTMRSDQSILVCLSGRGDKDIGTVASLSGVGLPEAMPGGGAQ